MDTLKTIALFKSDNCWMSETLIGFKPDPQLVEIFGTATLPTSFTEQADAETVLNEIQALNRNFTVYLRPF